MKMKEAFDRVIKEDSNREYIDLEIIGEELEVYDLWRLDYDWKELDIKSYYLGNWYWTDQYVGYQLYFLNDKPLAFSFKGARKSEEKFEFVSKEIAEEARDYILSFLREEELTIDFCDMEEEIGIGYHINYNSNVMDWSNIYYGGEKAEMIKVHTDGSSVDTCRYIRIKTHDNRIIDVNLKEIEFGFHIR